jgi:hypothetical protein
VGGATGEGEGWRESQPEFESPILAGDEADEAVQLLTELLRNETDTNQVGGGGQARAPGVG